MKTRTNAPHIPWFIPFILVIILTFVASLTLHADAPENVVIRGWLFTEDHDMSDAQVVVVLNDESCVRSVLLKNGRFEFELPVGAKARLFFEKPGHLTKEVLVDTRNALNTARARKLNKTVKFDVVLEGVDEAAEKIYAVPVGRIGFVNGTGTMKVMHHVEMIPAPHQATLLDN